MAKLLITPNVGIVVFLVFDSILIKANRGYSFSSVKKKMDSMQPYKPVFIITNCPNCNVFPDKGQYTISELTGIAYGEDNYGIPVLTFEEIAGLILQFGSWEVGLQQVHQVAVESLLDKIGIKYDAEKNIKLLMLNL